MLSISKAHTAWCMLSPLSGPVAKWNRATYKIILQIGLGIKPNNCFWLQLLYMLRSVSNSMSNDLNRLLERRNKLEEELNHKISADYSELMKKVSEGFRGMQESTAEYYKQKASEELDKMENNIQSGNKLGAINEKLLADTYISLATTF